MKELLEDILKKTSADDYAELRYQEMSTNSFMAQKGRLDQSASSTVSGVGVRVLSKGSWGFASTTDLDAGAIVKALEQARENASELAEHRQTKVTGLSSAEFSHDDIKDPAFEELKNISFEQKIRKVIDTEKAVLAASKNIHTASVRYVEQFEHKVIVNTAGACCSRRLARPEFRASAFAGEGADQVVTGNSVGICGGWKDLENHPTVQNIAEKTAKESMELLLASHTEGGKRTVILAPALVGLLCHEAVGHTVEADFVQAGSVAAGKIGHKVASPLVHLFDGGLPNQAGKPAGWLPFDDEGVICKSTPIIEAGILKNYLHDRQSAHLFGAPANGNARAWSYNDEPLIRMTNTWLAPGTQSLDEIIASTEDGLLIMGAGSGQADATGEFMFGSSYAIEIKNGKRGKIFRELTLSGVAFEVLQTVDAVSSEFHWDLGSGYCGKGQAAKVDAGGPYIRCKLTVGGRQA